MNKVKCPVCWRDIEVGINIDLASVFALHLDTECRRCEMSYKPVPPVVLRELELERTAARVMQLAADLRDDVEPVVSAVDNATRHELREWLLIALAAVDIDRQPSQLFGWIEGVAA